MSAGPFAQVKETIPIEIPRPRTGGAIIEHPEYYRIRNRIIQFLSEKSLPKAS